MFKNLRKPRLADSLADAIDYKSILLVPVGIS